MIDQIIRISPFCGASQPPRSPHGLLCKPIIISQPQRAMAEILHICLALDSHSQSDLKCRDGQSSYYEHDPEQPAGRLGYFP